MNEPERLQRDFPLARLTTVRAGGIGDVFAVRVAGNVVNTDELGSLEYAVSVGTKAIIVLGHTACGAVKASRGGAKRFRPWANVLCFQFFSPRAGKGLPHVPYHVGQPRLGGARRLPDRLLRP